MLVRYAAAVLIVLLSGCVSGAPEMKTDNPTAKRLVGKTRAEVLLCAGTPLREEPYGHSVEVTGVEFRPVPDGTEYDHCEDIFVRCLQ